MANNTAILLTRDTATAVPKLTFFESKHAAYLEYKKVHLEGKVDVELWTSNGGRVAKHRVFGPKVNFDAAKPITDAAKEKIKKADIAAALENKAKHEAEMKAIEELMVKPRKALMEIITKMNAERPSDQPIEFAADEGKKKLALLILNPPAVKAAEKDSADAEEVPPGTETETI